MRLWRLSPICAVVIVLLPPLLLLLLCMSISGLRVIIVAVVPAMLIVSVLIVVIIVLRIVVVLVVVILLLSLRRVLLVVILRLRLLASLRATVVLLLVCHIRGERYRISDSAKPHAPGAFYRGVVLRIVPLSSGDLQPLKQSLDVMPSTPKRPCERERSFGPGRRKVTARLRGTWQGPEIKERCEPWNEKRETGGFRWVSASS